MFKSVWSVHCALCCGISLWNLHRMCFEYYIFLGLLLRLCMSACFLGIERCITTDRVFQLFSPWFILVTLCSVNKITKFRWILQSAWEWYSLQVEFAGGALRCGEYVTIRKVGPAGQKVSDITWTFSFVNFPSQKNIYIFWIWKLPFTYSIAR